MFVVRLRYAAIAWREGDRPFTENGKEGNVARGRGNKKLKGKSQSESVNPHVNPAPLRGRVSIKSTGTKSLEDPNARAKPDVAQKTTILRPGEKIYDQDLERRLPEGRSKK